MTADTKRRLLIFGTGAFIGTLLSMMLFRYAGHVRETQPRESEKIEVILTTCALQPGEVFDERCVKKRVIEYQFVPPNAVLSNQVGLYVGKPVNVALTEGSAVRTVDFDSVEP